MSPVSAPEVHAALRAYPGLADVVVAEKVARHAGQCVVAYVAPSGRGLDLKALHAHARRLMPDHQVPAAIVVVDAIPVTAEGAANLEALPEPDLDGLMPYRAPDTPRRQALCAIFADVLGWPRLGLDDDFFSLGGGSVDAMLLAGRISAQLDVKISMADLFDAPTVAELDLRLDVTTSA
jgi:acyl carrier protein